MSSNSLLECDPSNSDPRDNQRYFFASKSWRAGETLLLQVSYINKRRKLTNITQPKPVVWFDSLEWGWLFLARSKLWLEVLYIKKHIKHNTESTSGPGAPPRSWLAASCSIALSSAASRCSFSESITPPSIGPGGLPWRWHRSGVDKIV